MTAALRQILLLETEKTVMENNAEEREVPDGAEVLVRNYPDAEKKRLSMLRPFEVVAYLK